jgi:hypothetical protein
VRISHRFRFIFFSFPKTGSVSVRRALDPVSEIKSTREGLIPGRRAIRGEDGQWLIPGHIAPRDLRTVFEQEGWPFDDYFKFTFVRNPWSRLVSLYRMVQENRPGAPPFGEWLLQTKPGGEGAATTDGLPYLWEQYGTYTLDNFVCDENGKRLVDQVFRLEDIALFPEAMRKRGIPLKLTQKGTVPRSNNKPAVDLDAYYASPAFRAVVAARYAKDIKEFGYSYPERT